MRAEHIICPHCNHVHTSDTPEFYKLDECKCRKCSEIFKATCEIVSTWFTEMVQP